MKDDVDIIDKKFDIMYNSMPMWAIFEPNSYKSEIFACNLKAFLIYGINLILNYQKKKKLTKVKIKSLN